MEKIRLLLSGDRSELSARIRNVAAVYRNYDIAWEIYRKIEGGTIDTKND
jgi:hypothetical protein